MLDQRSPSTTVAPLPESQAYLPSLVVDKTLTESGVFGESVLQLHSQDPVEARTDAEIISPEATEGYRSPWPEEVSTDGVCHHPYWLCSTCQQIDLGVLGMRGDGSCDSDRAVQLGHGLGGVKSGRESCDFCDVIWRSLGFGIKRLESDFPDGTGLTLELGTLSYEMRGLDSDQTNAHRMQMTGKGYGRSATNAIRASTRLSGDLIRLVNATDVQKPYAALSYCWGDSNHSSSPITTITSKFDEFQRKLPL
ncbi:uncharacterized protein PgNI_00078 [Pyricularia grisea]|uniref:Heterokaryon incompatibility domain-containing protein n=1 Tax=Pyricularia grisea TaxID=148305 RepID=A0A6P8BGM0_PYRGI|nr:uncharacterized protein PgNI_00078 [Pyricularia grisea]TLD15860.1 hypothetical protein PgNI_00078 [Pyricularia grisea]